MNTNKWLPGLASLLAAGTIVSVAMINRAQTPPQTPSPGNSQLHNLHHPGQMGAPAKGQRAGMQIDQHFIQMMIAHHQDATAMADLASTRAQRPEIKQLAQAIKADQTSEIDQMRTWYKQWFGQDVPATPRMGSGMGGQGMMHNPGSMGSGMMGSGMMGCQNMQGMRTDLNALKAAKDFDREFIRQMIPHHQMAVHMAQMLQNRTTRPEMKTLAASIIKAQTAEINQMQQWEKSWYGSATTN